MKFFYAKCKLLYFVRRQLVHITLIYVKTEVVWLLLIYEEKINKFNEQAKINQLSLEMETCSIILQPGSRLRDRRLESINFFQFLSNSTAS